ncbi:MAG: DUF86 domain-containing protein [Ardenticatenaceae bacterium]|nr:DUF86 domain-containing protein [Ardenticatenaceae bacterium]
MSRSTKNYLRHIYDEIHYLKRVTDNLSFEGFINDETLKRAVVRSLEIIGEAVKQIPESVRQLHPHIPWRAISRMRDRLIHHYFGIDYDIVWDVIENHLNPLDEAVKSLLSRNDID